MSQDSEKAKLTAEKLYNPKFGLALISLGVVCIIVYAIFLDDLIYMIVLHSGAILVTLGVAMTFKPHPDEKQLDMSERIDKKEKKPLITKKGRRKDSFENIRGEIIESEED